MREARTLRTTHIYHYEVLLLTNSSSGAHEKPTNTYWYRILLQENKENGHEDDGNGERGALRDSPATRSRWSYILMDFIEVPRETLNTGGLVGTKLSGGGESL